MPMPAGGDVPGIDADSERGRAFLLIAACAAFVISAWHSFSELRYVVGGKMAMATVTRVNPASEPGRGRPREYLRVELEFMERNEPRHAILKRSIGSSIEAGQQVELEYLPRPSERVRFRGDRPTAWLLIFAVSTVWMTWSIIRLARESRQPISGRRRRRSRPSST